MIFNKLPHPILTLTLWAVWLLLNNTLNVGHIILGLVLAIFISWLTARFWPEKVCIKRPLTLLKFLVLVLGDILVANIIVAKLILGKSNKLKPGFFSIHLDIESPLGISFLANTISLTPGTVSCDLTPDRRQLLVHALHVEDIQSTITDIKQRYEKPLMEVFTTC